MAKSSLAAIDFEFGRFRNVYDEVGKLTAALEIVSITGKIEAARIKQSSAELLGLLDDLSEFKAALKSSLQEIDSIGKDLSLRTREMRAELV